MKSSKAQIKRPFLFVWKNIKKVPATVGRWIFAPSARGKVRWATLGVLILVLVGIRIDYPKAYNQTARALNNWTESVPVIGQYKINEIVEKDFTLGLDLQGGAHIVYQADLSEVAEADRPEAMARLRDRIERRVNNLGVAEPLVQVAGEDRLVVEIAGVDVSEAINQIGGTPLLEFREPSGNTDTGGSSNDPGQTTTLLSDDDQKELDAYNAEKLAKAKELRAQLETGTASFEDLAKEYSEDLATKSDGGKLGVVTKSIRSDIFNATKGTPLGKLVPDILDTETSYYIVRVDDRNSDKQEMEVSHILICYDGADGGCNSGRSRQDAFTFINQLKAEVTKQNFSDRAVENSNDPSVSQNKGDLGWLEPGLTVKEFEDAAKSLPIGVISDPVETGYGFHLLLKNDQRPYEEVTVSIISFDKKQGSDYVAANDQFVPTGLSGANVEDAQLVFAPNTNAPEISIKFDEEGTKLFSELTQKYLNQPIGIYLDGEPISTPVVQTQITTGEAVITGRFTIDEARNLARQLKDGALPVDVEIISQQTVGATLGNVSLQESMMAAFIGLLLVIIFMLLYYRLLGLNAILALFVYGIVSLMFFKTIPVTLTLSGIAGFILSIGMAVDANVLVFERFKEERAAGKGLDDSVKLAFQRAWPSIRDGNFSTLITCLILAWFGTSIVQGFAITLGVGVLISMFSAILVTKTLVRFVLGWTWLNKRRFLYGVGWTLKG